MAARNPSSFETWWDEAALTTGKPIIETVPDSIITGQQQIFDGAEGLILEKFKTIRTDEIDVSSWTAAMEILRWHIDPIDLCGEDGAADDCRVTVGARVWVDSGSAGAFRFQTLVEGDSGTATFSNTSPAWVEVSGSIVAIGDGTQENMQLDLKLTSGYTYAYCNGIYVWKEQS